MFSYKIESCEMNLKCENEGTAEKKKSLDDRNCAEESEKCSFFLHFISFFIRLFYLIVLFYIPFNFKMLSRVSSALRQNVSDFITIDFIADSLTRFSHFRLFEYFFAIELVMTNPIFLVYLFFSSASIFLFSCFPPFLSPLFRL